MTNSNNCGCRAEPTIENASDGHPSINFKKMKIIHCPLHAAAERLLEAAKIGLKEMRLWESLDECDCDLCDGHVCGINRLRESIKKVDDLLAEAEKEDTNGRTNS